MLCSRSLLFAILCSLAFGQQNTPLFEDLISVTKHKAVHALGSSDSNTTSAHPDTTTIPTDTTTKPAIPTTHPTTPTTHPTTPTTHPTTPTTPPTHPTTHPTTPPTKPTTPTTPPPKPTTTTPKPTPSPKPLPAPEQGKWSYTDKKMNTTCVMIQFAAQFNVTYTKSENKTSVLFNVPKEAEVVDGGCTNETQFLKLSWAPVNGTQAKINNTMTLVYGLNTTTNMYFLKSVSAILAPEVFGNPNETQVEVAWVGKEWEVPMTSSYRCHSVVLHLSDSLQTTKYVAAVTLTNLQEEAFRSNANQRFSAARECPSGPVPDSVPIVVGSVLAGLVLVVLGAYLVARRRSASRGYLSM